MPTSRRNFVRIMSGLASMKLDDSLAERTGFRWSERSTFANETNSPSLAAIRAQFPALHQLINGQPLIYLDSAATTHRPIAVIEATSDFYQHDNANPSRFLHTLARRSANLYEGARQTVARFVNADSPEEIIWTRGTTEAINLVASAWGGVHLRPDDEILLTEAEHYSNLLPWQLVAARTGARLRFVEVDEEGRLRLDRLDSLLSKRTKMVAFAQVSNVLGQINPAKDICEKAHRVGATVLIDAAQFVPHLPIDVQAIGCDFLAFSGHKMMGPMAIGVLWARREILENLPPYQSGSNMVHDAQLEAASNRFSGGSRKFEAGTPNAAGAIGLASAVKYLDSLGWAGLWRREQELTKYALDRLREVEGLRILGTLEAAERIPVFSFVFQDFSAVDLVHRLDSRGIAIRGGDLAALPLLKRMGVTAAARASFYHYTQASEIDAFVQVLHGLRREKPPAAFRPRRATTVGI